MIELQWRWYGLADFDALTLYAHLKLRQDVFIVEQNCVYPDMDQYDAVSQHLLGFDQNGQVLASLRLVPPGFKYAEPSIGRVITHPDARRGGAGSLLVTEGLRFSQQLYPNQGHRIGAQSHLQGFYGNFGFVPVGQEYLEDNISHIDMVILA
ncbi:GNAT family N-acetyltransferase [Iodobacter ciconiae]|uniref:GNAT family N-acetyltransferase n=1 Tax=Iodobacter ciconiae TaxID=2496266 RepID=A0A3S8ZVE4_9NEIS|nr:GNAT family N-acetyltransferase [Iodobacter ciconiae]AZN37395.1 GNAT family N-acetyltransferase [Iodobacter ciconiae]